MKRKIATQHRSLDISRSLRGTGNSWKCILPTLVGFLIGNNSYAQDVPLPLNSGEVPGRDAQPKEQNGWGKPCVKPIWPKQSLRHDEQGVVTINFIVDVDGKVLETKVRKSSGFPLLDQAAQQAVERCRFEPGYENGRPVKTSQNLQYVWTLENPNSWQYQFPPSSWLNR